MADRMIAEAEKKLAKAFRYERECAADARKIRIACAITDAHARKMRRLMTAGAAVSAETVQILEFLRRAS